MKGVDTIARIRREFFVRGKTIKEIVRELHVSRNTVRKVLRSGATEFTYERGVQPLPRLGPWKDELDRLLMANAAKPARERLTFFWRRSGETMTGNIYGIAVAMLSIARHHVQLGDSEIARIRALVDDCNPRQSGLTPKNTERLRQFLDERNVAILLGLPERLVTEARQLKPVDEEAALMVQTAVAIELLMMTMVRRKNLVSLDEEVHVKWSRSGRRGICHIAVDAAEVKNREPLQFELPERSAMLLRLYMQEFQPVLRSTLSRKLFPGRDSTTHKNAAGLTTQITDTVFKYTGISLHVHLFRHIGALLYLKRNPGGYEVLRRVFGHKSLTTTVSAYCGLEALFAAQHFDDEILAHNDTLKRRYRQATRARGAKRRRDQ